VLLCLIAGPGHAQGGETYEERGVAVDRTAATATQAREEALAEGRRVALQRLLERLAPPEDRARLPRLSDVQVLDLVQSFEVESERTSAVRYLAILTVRFQPEGIRTLLRQAGGTGAAGRLTAAVPIGGAEEWVAVRRRLAEVVAVRETRILSLAPRRAQVELLYQGSEAQLAAALAQRGLTLARDGEGWRLSLGEGARTGTGRP